jgi:cell division protein FtsB
VKALAALLGALILLIQYPLWLGKGGWLRAWEFERQVSLQRDHNSRREVRNSALAAEVRDLKQGTEAIEERARYDLGMVRSDELFFHVVETEEDPAQNPLSAAPRP